MELSDLLFTAEVVMEKQDRKSDEK